MTAYGQQWSRVKALFKAGRIPAADLIALGARHQKWFAEQQRTDATVFMVQDLAKFADYVEEFGLEEPTDKGAETAVATPPPSSVLSESDAPC